MLRSTDRIKTTHAGALPRPDDLREMVQKRTAGQTIDQTALAARLDSAVAEIVKKQVACGVDGVNDGELSKANFTHYVRERIEGFELKKDPSYETKLLSITARDEDRGFAEYFEGRRWPPSYLGTAVCTGPLKYVGHAALKEDLDRFKKALAGVKVEETYLPANTPGTIEHWMPNEYYKSDEEFVFAIAEAMREEYNAIVEAGFVLQIDDPDLPDGWNCIPDITVPDYRKYAQMRVEALNHALRDIPAESIRLHVCWGSFHGPHSDDIPLTDIADIIFSVKAMSYSIEASNPAHEHEWKVFEEVKLPDGATLVPGVVGHCTDFIEHPDLVAERLVRYAKLVGRENVIGGTDCGLGTRVGHPSVCWAKLETLAEGARRATKILWS